MKFWLALFIILLLVLDVIWMLDGFLNVQYGDSLNRESYVNQSTTFAYRLFADKPLMNLYYRIIISLLVLIGVIMTIIFLGKMSKYQNMLDASNLKYRSLFMGMQSGFALRKINRDKDGSIKDIRFLEINPAFRLHTGLTDIDIIDKTVEEVFPAAKMELLEDYDKIARYGGSFTKILKSDELDKILRITAYQHEEDVFATIVEDITKEQQTEDELKESMQLKTILLDTINEGVYYIDKELNIKWVNKQILELLNVSQEKMLGKKCHQIWFGNDQMCAECPLPREENSYQSITLEKSTESGKYLQIHSNPVFNSDNELKGVVLTVFDLTEWKAALDNIQQKQEHLNLALEVGQMTAWEWNSSDGKVKLEQASVLTGNSDNQWNIRQLVRYLHPADRKDFLRQQQAIVKGELSELRVQARIRTIQGKWTWFNLLGRIKETDAVGRPVKVIGITYNIDNLKTIATELEQTNRELTQLKEQLEKEVAIRVGELREKDLLMIRQSRQAAMGEMIGNIAHQWRQPLNSIAVIIQDFLDAWDFGEISREYLVEKIDLSMSVINHMSQTIDDFRDFFSPDNQPVQFDLDIQITKTINILKDMYANQGIKIISQLKPCQLTSYAREFSQVLINILNNSKDAINEQKIKQPFIEVKMDLINNGRHVLITVLDNAGGIPENILDKIFDPYFTTKEETNGTGVGLYMSKTIIEKHMDGEIWAENVKDGALFSIRLPLGK